MDRFVALALAASLCACHFTSDPLPATTDQMVGQWHSTDHNIVTDMPLARAASGADAVEGTATFRNYYGPGKDQGFTVTGTLNGVTWTYVADIQVASWPLGDNTHLSPNPTFTVTFRDANRMLLFSDTEVQLEFVRQ